MQRKIKIVIADDQELNCQGLKSIFSQLEKFEIIGEASDVKGLLRLMQVAEPDIVILGAELRAPGCRQALVKIKEKHSDVKAIIIGFKIADDVMFDFIVLGAKAYLLRNLKAEEFIKKVNEVYEKGSAFHDGMLERFIAARNEKGEPGRSRFCLTDMEMKVYKEIRLGKKVKDIARDLQISSGTVHTHKKNMFAKAGVHSVVELINSIEKDGWN